MNVFVTHCLQVKVAWSGFNQTVCGGPYQDSVQTPAAPSVGAGHGGVYWPFPPTPLSPGTPPPQPHTAAVHHLHLQTIKINVSLVINESGPSLFIVN